MNKEYFYKIAAPFFENGIMYEIYSSDNLCICNIANQCYAVFCYHKDRWKAISGICIQSKYIPSIVEDNDFIFRLIKADVHNYLIGFYLDQENFKNLMNVKKYTDLNGPSEFIDYEMEEKLMKNKGFTK